MNRKYELVYIVSPDATDDQVTDLHKQVEAIVQRIGGELEKSDNWGRRKLAYPIGRHKEGIYVLDVINGGGDLMKEIDRRLKVSDLDHPTPGGSDRRGAGGRRADTFEAYRDLAASSCGARAARRSTAGRGAARAG